MEQFLFLFQQRESSIILIRSCFLTAVVLSSFFNWSKESCDVVLILDEVKTIYTCSLQNFFLPLSEVFCSNDTKSNNKSREYENRHHVHDFRWSVVFDWCCNWCLWLLQRANKCWLCFQATDPSWSAVVLCKLIHGRRVEVAWRAEPVLTITVLTMIYSFKQLIDMT